MANIIPEAGLNRLRSYWAALPTVGRYKIGATWYTSPIESQAVEENGAVTVSFYMARQNGGATVTEKQICLQEGGTLTVLARNTDSFTFPTNRDRYLWRFKFGITVIE